MSVSVWPPGRFRRGNRICKSPSLSLSLSLSLDDNTHIMFAFSYTEKVRFRLVRVSKPQSFYIQLY